MTMTTIPSDRLRQHIYELAIAFKVVVKLNADMAPHAAGCGYLGEDAHLPMVDRRRFIVIAPVIDETTYAVALHELGHCLSALGMVTEELGSEMMRVLHHASTLRDVRLELDTEMAAWEWARHYALEWTDVMTFVESISLESYKRDARRYGVRI